MIATPGWHAPDRTRDYAIVKTLDAARAMSGDEITLLDKDHHDFRNLGENDRLYVVAHGSEDGLWGHQDDGAKVEITKQQLTTWLNDGELGLQRPIREIRLLACLQARQPPDPLNKRSVEEKMSPVDYIQSKLRIAGVQISGARGFTFATTSSAATGRSRVIANGEYYSWMERDPNTWNEGVQADQLDRISAALRYQFANAAFQQTFSVGELNVRSYVGNEAVEGLSLLIKRLYAYAFNGEYTEALPNDRGDLADYAGYFLKCAFEKGQVLERLRDFLRRRDAIYVRIRERVSHAAGESITEVLGNLREDEDWKQALRDQEALFDEFGLFIGTAQSNTAVQLGYEERTSHGV